jgi:hypothetical protein
MVKQERSRPQDRDQDALYFWDYRYLAAGWEMESRRDYFVVPSDVLDILLAAGSAAGVFQKLAALNLAQADLLSVIETGSFLAGRELAASNNQAWIAIAFSKSRALLAADTWRNRIVLRYCIGMPENIIGSFVVPVAILLIAAVSATVPEYVVWSLQKIGAPMPTDEVWSKATTVFIQLAGVIVLPAFGERLGRKALGYVRGILS